jgi:hypothetical protein
MTHDPQMVQKVVLAMHVTRHLDGGDAEALAEAALEASHHAELVEALRDAVLLIPATHKTVLAKCTAVLAKIGGAP